MTTITKKDGEKDIAITYDDYFYQVRVSDKTNGYSWAIVSISNDLFLRDYEGANSLGCLDCALKNLFEFLGLEVKK